MYLKGGSMEDGQHITDFLGARKKAMSLLQIKDRTEWEITDRLLRSGFSDEETQDAIEYVRSFHYIDDERYAVRYVEIYHNSRSIKRLCQDLYKRHVPQEYIDIALERIEWDESEALQKEYSKLLKQKNVISHDELSYEEKQKIMAKLYRRGFCLDNIHEIMGM